jgi:hypothetical protein
MSRKLKLVFALALAVLAYKMLSGPSTEVEVEYETADD